ncbi:sialidase family protein [Actinomadura rudentiformis]|uniref:Exo-alpha-sialidase n=1 Tax=Actinomadura rudentiformis TaxID=359158 RepID=A0A6H9YI00_9ACTN|nr:sialidase family protein [Actinomadura rudentiformis]KAB2343700.1 exo-alpha-sialidase [Actinomadura rudentiformis]
MHRIRMLAALAAAGGMAIALTAGSPTASATGAGDRGGATAARMGMADPATQFPRNDQDMPTLAVDPVHPNVVAATANDLVDLQRCSKQAATLGAACSLPASTTGEGGGFNRGVGFSGVYFSYDSGRRWTQPTYQGLTAAGCDPEAEPCTPKPGPIHTVPNYYEKGFAARGGSSVAFGPVLRNGKFSWANGSRLYLSSQGATLNNAPIEPGRIDSRRALMVSHIDDPTPARAADQSNWSTPVIVPDRTPAISNPTQGQIWADNAASSRYFGHVYTCWNDFRIEGLNGPGPIEPTVSVSRDGGRTWATQGFAPPVNSAADGYRMSCTVRTDSHGVVYLFINHYSGQFPSFEPSGKLTIVKSFDGGATWTKPVDFMPMNTGCFYVDRLGNRCTEAGPAGTANEQGPSVGIANGAPTGAGATNEMVLAWSDGRFGQNQESALLSYSRDRARTWSAPARISLPGDRVLYTALAIAPDASRVYLTYNAYTTPFSPTTANPRLFRGVLRSAAMRHGEPTRWRTDYAGPTGDARGTSFVTWNYPEFLGYHVSAIATRRYGAGAWTDVARAADCPAMDVWRQKSLEALKPLTPAPWPLAECPAKFGNSDIVSATTAR